MVENDKKKSAADGREAEPQVVKPGRVRSRTRRPRAETPSQPELTATGTPPAMPEAGLPGPVVPEVPLLFVAKVETGGLLGLGEEAVAAVTAPEAAPEPVAAAPVAPVAAEEELPQTVADVAAGEESAAAALSVPAPSAEEDEAVAPPMSDGESEAAPPPGTHLTLADLAPFARPSFDAAAVQSAIEQARNLTLQADTIVRGLAEELRALSQRQMAYERKQVLSSAVAYILFCGIIFAGLYFVFDLRSAKRVTEQEVHEAELQRVVERLALAERELERDRLAAHAAFEVYQLMEQARFAEALERFVAVQDVITNPAELALLQERVDSVRWRLAEDAYRDGLDLFNNGNFEQARDAFFRSLSLKAETPYVHLLHYYLATALHEVGDFEGARNFYRFALNGNLASDMEVLARYHYAVATENVGATSEAYELYEAFLKRFRYHRLAEDVVRRVGRIDRARVRDRNAAQRAQREEAQRTEGE